MRYLQLSIGKKIWLSFLLLLCISIFSVVFTFVTLNKSIILVDEMSVEIDPLTNDYLEFYRAHRECVYGLIKYVNGHIDDYVGLDSIMSVEYQEAKNRVEITVNSACFYVDKSAFMLLLVSADSLVNAERLLLRNHARLLVKKPTLREEMLERENISKIITKSEGQLETLQEFIDFNSALSLKASRNVVSSFEVLKLVMAILLLLGLVITVLVSILLTRNITNPISILRDKIQELSLGKIPTNIEIRNKDEIGEMSNGVNSLISGFKSQVEYSQKIERGNINTEFNVLSSEDILGHTLLSMVNKLQTVLDETNRAVKNASEEGLLNSRINIDDDGGSWFKLADAINNLLISIATPILEVNKVVNGLANGNLSLRCNSLYKGDIGQLSTDLNLAIENLSELVQQISSDASKVDNASAEMKISIKEMDVNTYEIASAIAQISRGAQDQLSRINDVSNILESTLESTKGMSIKANTIKQTAQTGAESSERGSLSVKKVLSCMKEISTYSEKTTSSMKILSDRSNDISLILEVINRIASQTNLLALNAAIEAAQAGDSGRGFAVLADEIRKLAEQSKKSANEIEKLVIDVQNDTSSASGVISLMTESVKNGEKATYEAAEVFELVRKSTSDTLLYTNEIVLSSNIQNDNISSVVTLTEGIVVIAEQTASATEEVTTSASEHSNGMENLKNKSTELAGVATSLKGEVNKFVLTNREIV